MNIAAMQISLYSSDFLRNYFKLCNIVYCPHCTFRILAPIRSMAFAIKSTLTVH